MRNSVISICKGIAIILMVIGHAEAPELITNFIYTFHMPLFFITAGYFFNRKYLSDPWTFCAKRFKGLYIPFLKWSLIFLVLHNVWHHFGILNETYGNWTGGVTHPYTWHAAMQRLTQIVFGMSGYDEFMAGAFWFFRGLLVSSILFLILYKILEENTRFKNTRAVVVIMVAALAFTAFRIFNGVKITIIPNGGMREIWGLFFFALGVIFRQYESKVKGSWWLTLCAFLLILLAGKLHLSGMNNNGKPLDLLTLPLTGLTGFLMVYWLSGYINNRGGKFAKLLTYIGDNTLFILLWHIPAYKLVSLLKIWYYDLDFGQIGCHMVIHYNHTDFFWVLYSIVGVAVPIAIITAYRRISQQIKEKRSKTPIVETIEAD